MTDDQPFGISSVEYNIGLFTCVRSQTTPKFLRNEIWKKINFLVYEKKAYPTLFIYKKNAYFIVFLTLSLSLDLYKNV